MAFAVDMLLKGVYLLVAYLLFFQTFNLGMFLNQLDTWSVMAVIIVITLPVHIYTLVCESLMEGQTFGKKIVKIKVVKIDGFQAGFGDYLIRWFFRLIDIIPFLGVVGFISMLASKKNQRLGGIASGTAVINLKNTVTISHTILENLSENYVPFFPQVIALTDNDVRIIKENYQKALIGNDRQIISKLSNRIKEILKLESVPNQFSERQFIGVIIKDYNFYTGKDF